MTTATAPNAPKSYTIRLSQYDDEDARPAMEVLASLDLPESLNPEWVQEAERTIDRLVREHQTVQVARTSLVITVKSGTTSLGIFEMPILFNQERGAYGLQTVTPLGRKAIEAEIERIAKGGKLVSIQAKREAWDAWVVIWHRDPADPSDYATHIVYSASFPSLNHGHYDLEEAEAQADAAGRVGLLRPSFA